MENRMIPIRLMAMYTGMVGGFLIFYYGVLPMSLIFSLILIIFMPLFSDEEDDDDDLHDFK